MLITGSGHGLGLFPCFTPSPHTAQLQPLPRRYLPSFQHLALATEVLASPVVLLSVLFFSQDPTNLDKFNVSNFFHVKNNMRIIDPGMDT